MQLRPTLAAAAARADPQVRLVLISGASLAGKTRAAMEAMRVELHGSPTPIRQHMPPYRRKRTAPWVIWGCGGAVGRCGAISTCRGGGPRT